MSGSARAARGRQGKNISHLFACFCTRISGGGFYSTFPHLLVQKQGWRRVKNTPILYSTSSLGSVSPHNADYCDYCDDGARSLPSRPRGGGSGDPHNEHPDRRACKGCAQCRGHAARRVRRVEGQGTHALAVCTNSTDFAQGGFRRTASQRAITYSALAVGRPSTSIPAPFEHAFGVRTLRTRKAC